MRCCLIYRNLPSLVSQWDRQSLIPGQPPGPACSAKDLGSEPPCFLFHFFFLLTGRMSSPSYNTSAPISRLIGNDQLVQLERAYYAWSGELQGTARKGAIWIAGNLSTVQYCSAHNGSAVVVPHNLDFPFDNYFCQFSSGSDIPYFSAMRLLEKLNIEHEQFGSTFSAAGRRARTTASLLVIVSLASAILACAL